MRNIKTRDRTEEMIKTIDRTSIVAGKMKSAYAKTKELGTEREESPSDYAEERTSGTAKRIGEATTNKVRECADKAKIKAKEDVKERTINSYFKSKGAMESDKAHKTKGVENINAAEKRQTIKARKAGTKKMVNVKSTRRSEQAMRSAKRAASSIRKAAQAVITGLKAMIGAITAGGWAAGIIIIVCVVFGAAIYIFGDESSNLYIQVSPEVEAYSSEICRCAEEYGVSDYEELIKAIMMEESGGKGRDPMGASESSFNMKYPRKPGGIKSPNYSIKCGVETLVSCLDAAKCGSPLDMEKISLALQGYEYGEEYISWAIKKYGGYSEANSKEYSKKEVNGAGNAKYAMHVLRYYPYGNYSDDIEYTGPGKLGLPIKGMSRGDITSYYGPRFSPGRIGSTNHKGIDVGYEIGTHVLACEKGTVTMAGLYGGYGKCIMVSHSGGIVTLYGHLDLIKVCAGQRVSRGQYIGEVGNTGISTGPHLHFSVIVNGKYINPLKGWI